MLAVNWAQRNGQCDPPWPLVRAAPAPRHSASAALVPAGGDAGRRLLVFGGAGAGRCNDAHLLDLASWAWSRPPAAGTAPSPRQGAALAVAGATPPKLRAQSAAAAGVAAGGGRTRRLKHAPQQLGTRAVRSPRLTRGRRKAQKVTRLTFDCTVPQRNQQNRACDAAASCAPRAASPALKPTLVFV